MKNLSIEVSNASKINAALGISDERADEMAELIESVIDEVIEAGPDPENPVRITDLAKKSVDKINPTLNELFYIGIKFGELVERNATHGAMQAMMESILPSREELASAILRSTGGDA